MLFPFHRGTKRGEAARYAQIAERHLKPLTDEDEAEIQRQIASDPDDFDATGKGWQGRINEVLKKANLG